MKIGIIGYGKMGKTIAELIDIGKKHEYEIIYKNPSLAAKQLAHCDVAIEFTRPEYAADNIKMCVDAKVPVVVGTTAWYERFDEVSDYVLNNNGALLYATNFSIGVNLFWAACAQLANAMNQYPEYEVKIEEIHHTAKLDSPSGTAITTAQRIIEMLDRKTAWVESETPNASQIGITAHRINHTPGTHTVQFQSEIDSISIRHEAKNRYGFAKGAILAAEFIHQKQGVFNMNHLLNIH